MKKSNILNERITAIYVRRSVSDKDKDNNSLSIEAQKVMRNNLLNFAEFERETIAARVADAYNTKARETGFYQGGKMYYGFSSERRTINGKTGSVLVPSEQAEAVKTANAVNINVCRYRYGVISGVPNQNVS